MGNIGSSAAWAAHDRFKIEGQQIHFFRHSAMPMTFSTSC
jgi:hypothetical protein